MNTRRTFLRGLLAAATFAVAQRLTPAACETWKLTLDPPSPVGRDWTTYTYEWGEDVYLVHPKSEPVRRSGYTYVAPVPPGIDAQAYMRQLQALDEPLRTQLLTGDFR